MYQAKAKGRNIACFFDSSMQEALEHRSRLQAALRHAHSRNEFLLHYQLQVNALGQPIGAEALLRWAHPDLGMVSTSQFIPVAEESDLILLIGNWVLTSACEQLARWHADAHLSHLTIAVNVSARQFRDATFVARVLDAVKASGIRPERLKLELTESLVLDNVDGSIAKMRELKKHGIRFAMDDFGTGYSSLSYLSRLPIDRLKIDQSFVRDITTDRHDAAIVQTIISMANSLEMDVIAEGVETLAQKEFLDLRGCHAYQGYFFAKPVEIERLESMLAALFSVGQF
jgi:EAL domain-containing protein (putative c-di-GMP-specific phosphodiesterase class I)